MSDLNSRISWTALQTFQACQRSYELQYIDNYRRIPRFEPDYLMLGKLFHAGVAGWLEFWGDEPVERIRKAKVRADGLAHTEYRSNDFYEVDWEFTDRVKVAINDTMAMLDFYLPLLLNEPIRPATYEELGLEGQGYVIEHELDLEFKGHTIRGFIDAIMYHEELKTYLIVDWKTYSREPRPDMWEVDGQLYFYSAMLQQMTGKPFNKVGFYAFRKQLPKRGTDFLKTRKGEKLLEPNTGAQSYDSTWEIWSADLKEAGVPDVDGYEDLMRPKLKPVEHYFKSLMFRVSEVAHVSTLENTEAVLDAIDFAHSQYAKGKALPATLSKFACERCPFAELCSGAFRHGGDPTPFLQERFLKVER